MLRFNPIFLLLPLLAACPGESVTETDTDDTDEAERLTGRYGAVMVKHYAADARDDEAAFAQALFVSDDGGLINLAECGLGSDLCLTDLPAEGASTSTSADTSFFEGLSFYDAGASIEVGGQDIPQSFDYEIPVYEGTITAYGTGSGGISIGGELVDYAGTDDFTFAAPIALTAPDAMTELEIGVDDTVDLAWTPGAAGDVVLRYRGTVTHLADSGSHTMSVDDIGLLAPFDSTALRMSRATFSEVDAAGNTVTVQTVSEQWVYVNYENLDGWDELFPSDTCAGAVAGDAVTSGDYYGTTEGFTDSIDLPEDNEVTGYDSAGADGFVKVDLLAGQTLTVTYRQAVLDASLYILSDCETALSALEGADDTLNGEPETLVFNSVGAQTVYVVLDAYQEDMGGDFTLELTIE